MAQTEYTPVDGMPADLLYAAAEDIAGGSASVSIFADLPHVRALLRDDAEAGGCHVREVADIAALLQGDVRPLGEIVLLDCPEISDPVLAALSRIDLHAARYGARLIVSTTLPALDDVFARLGQSRPQLLVDQTRAERVLALGRALAGLPGSCVRELSEEDRLMLLRLSEQVNQIAGRIDRLEAPIAMDPATDEPSAFRLQAPEQSFSGKDGANTARLVRAARPPLPDPRMIRRIIRQRQLRARFFDAGLFADPAWDMLLDLTAARAEHIRVSVTSLCIASEVPPTTALRWIAQMTEAGLFDRVEDDTDRRRAFIALSDKAADAMARYFADLGADAKSLT